jgi:hypothetical protein
VIYESRLIISSEPRLLLIGSISGNNFDSLAYPDGHFNYIYLYRLENVVVVGTFQYGDYQSESLSP